MTRTTSNLVLAGIALLALAACDDTMVTSDTMLAGPASPVEGACLAAVVDQVGTGGLSVLRVEESEANTAVYITVPGAEEPWLCLASPDGTVQEVRYTGSEGFL